MLIVNLEGIDGCGKGTQTAMLIERLEKEGLSVKMFSFPVYEAFIGSEIGKLLSGRNEITAMNLDIKSTCLWYAADRCAALNPILQWKDYDILLLNRYTMSNMAYQSCRTNDPGIMDWIFDLEHGELKLPIPDICILMDLDSRLNMVDKKGDRDYVDGKDVYESDTSFLEKARQAYFEAMKRYNAYVVICGKNKTTLRPREEINDEIFGLIKKKFNGVVGNQAEIVELHSGITSNDTRMNRGFGSSRV